MSNFNLETVPTAALIWALHERGFDVESPRSVIGVKTQRHERKAAVGDGKVIHLSSHRKAKEER